MFIRGSYEDRKTALLPRIHFRRASQPGPPIKSPHTRKFLFILSKHGTRSRRG